MSLFIQQLNYIYSEVISILTSGVHQLLERKTRFDLRKLLGGNKSLFIPLLNTTGADTFLNHLTYMMDHDTSILFNSFHCLFVNESVREKITNIITQAKTPELL